MIQDLVKSSLPFSLHFDETTNTQVKKQVDLILQSFYGTAASKLQDKLPLKNSFLQQLGCLNPLKKSMESTVDSILSLAGRL